MFRRSRLGLLLLDQKTRPHMFLRATSYYTSTSKILIQNQPFIAGKLLAT